MDIYELHFLGHNSEQLSKRLNIFSDSADNIINNFLLKHSQTPIFATNTMKSYPPATTDYSKALKQQNKSERYKFARKSVASRFLLLTICLLRTFTGLSKTLVGIEIKLTK